MGINISVVKVIERTMEDCWDFKQRPYYKTEDQQWFDYLRYSGDREFVIENRFYAVDNDGDGDLQRPEDFDKTREWVRKNVFEGNQERLLTALDKMEADESLAFTWSW